MMSRFFIQVQWGFHMYQMKNTGVKFSGNFSDILSLSLLDSILKFVSNIFNVN